MTEGLGWTDGKKSFIPGQQSEEDRAWLCPGKYCIELKKHGETGIEFLLYGNFRPGTASFAESYISYLREKKQVFSL